MLGHGQCLVLLGLISSASSRYNVHSLLWHYETKILIQKKIYQCDLLTNILYVRLLFSILFGAHGLYKCLICTAFPWILLCLQSVWWGFRICVRLCAAIFIVMFSTWAALCTKNTRWPLVDQWDFRLNEVSKPWHVFELNSTGKQRHVWCFVFCQSKVSLPCMLKKKRLKIKLYLCFESKMYSS